MVCVRLGYDCAILALFMCVYEANDPDQLESIVLNSTVALCVGPACQAYLSQKRGGGSLKGWWGLVRGGRQRNAACP